MIDTRIIGPILLSHILVYSLGLLLGFKFEPILAQILENLTNFYFGSDFANCTNFWSKNILRRGSHFTKIAKIQASRFHFQCESPPPPHKLLHMGHNVVKNIFRRGSHFTKIARKCTFYFSQALIPRAFYTPHLVLLRI